MNPITITSLSRDYLNSHTRQFIDLDKTIIDEPWTEENFLVDLPKKWIYSQVAYANAFIVGFVIASEKYNYSIHVHRIAINADFQRQGIGRKLLLTAAESAYFDGLRYMTLKTSKENKIAQRFYSNIGFTFTKSDNINKLEYKILLEKLLQK